VRDDLAAALRGLPPEELLEARRYVERLVESAAERPGALRPAPPGVPERRRHARYWVNVRATYFRHSMDAADSQVGPLREAVVRDISRSGIRFFAHEALEPGELLTVHLPSPLGVRRLCAEVVRAERRGSQHECAAAFVDLDDVVAAERHAEREAAGVHVLVAAEEGPERDALTELLVKQGYTVHTANAVPEALAMVTLHRCAIVLATAPMLLADGGMLLLELGKRAADVLSIALVTVSDLDGPNAARLRACHDFLCEPDRPHAVQVIVGRAYRRLAARRARQAAPEAT